MYQSLRFLEEFQETRDVPQTLCSPRYSTEHGKTAVCPVALVTLIMGTSKLGSTLNTGNRH